MPAATGCARPPRRARGGIWAAVIHRSRRNARQQRLQSRLAGHRRTAAWRGADGDRIIPRRASGRDLHGQRREPANTGPSRRSSSLSTWCSAPPRRSRATRSRQGGCLAADRLCRSSRFTERSNNTAAPRRRPPPGQEPLGLPVGCPFGCPGAMAVTQPCPRPGRTLPDLHRLQAGQGPQLPAGCLSCKRSKINFKDHNMTVTCGNVELRGFEPRTSCMP